MMVVPAATAFHVDVPIDVDAVGATASNVAGTGIRTTTAAASTPTGRGASAPTTATTATTATTTATTTAAPGISVRGHGEAGQNEGGHRRRKQLAE
jgi:hypothetical protein